MIAQARITSDTRAAVHLETETIELHGANLSEVRSRVKQVFINASRRGGEPMDVVIIESDARHHLRVEPTGRIASRSADDRPLFGPASVAPPATAPQGVPSSASSAAPAPVVDHDGSDMEDLEATVLRPASIPAASASSAAELAAAPDHSSPSWSGGHSSATEDPEDTDTAERQAVPDAGSHRGDPGPEDSTTEPTPEDDHGMADLDATIIGTRAHLSRDQEGSQPLGVDQGPGPAAQDHAPVGSNPSQEETPEDGVLAGSPWAPVSPEPATSASAGLPTSSPATPDAAARHEASSPSPAPHVAASANAWEPAVDSSPDLDDTRMMPISTTTHPDESGGSGRRRAATTDAPSADLAPGSVLSPSPAFGSGHSMAEGTAQDRGAPGGVPQPATPSYGATGPQTSESVGPQVAAPQQLAAQQPVPPHQHSGPQQGGPMHAAPHHRGPQQAPRDPQQPPAAQPIGQPGIGQPGFGQQVPGPQGIAPQNAGHQSVGQQSGPGQQPLGPGAPATSGGQTARPTLQDLQAATARPTTAPPTRGWQGFLHRVTGGAVSPSPGRQESIERQNTQRVRKNLDGPKNIAVVNLKGGAHKTTASLMIAATLGVARGGSVLAWDNNETRGTLGWRGARADHQHTAVDLLHNLEHLRSANATVADLDGYVRPQGGTRFDILASDEDPGSAALIDGESFDELNETLSRFYRLKVIDTGNNVRASNWLAAVRSADQLVIVSTVREDTFNAAAWMIDELRASGLAEQVDHAVTVLSHSSKGKVDSVLRTRLVNHFGAHTRAVTEVPYEPQFVDGSPLNWDRIAPATKDAWLNATAQMVDGL